jgi:tetraacyldisaccharide 4'-kinase
VGSPTVGGAGKSSLAQWLAAEAVLPGGRAAILLRGHGARGIRGTAVVPDFAGYVPHRGVDRFGDEALGHRAFLPRSVAIVVDRNRHRGGRVAVSGYGAKALILDDGWEQPTLRWNELWIALDPGRPLGNGALLPAGPLRRPGSELAAADRIAFILEEPDEEVPVETVAWVAKVAPNAIVIRFRRTLLGVSPPGSRAEPARVEVGTRVALVSGIGKPERLTRFARGAGLTVGSHAAFPDHARFDRGGLRRALDRAAKDGAEMALLTAKDEPRWPSGFDAPLPPFVLRTVLRPVDPVERALAPLRGALAAERPIG